MKQFLEPAMQPTTNVYVESCPDCDGLDVRLVKIISEEDDEMQVEVKCQECGTEWIDYVGT